MDVLELFPIDFDLSPTARARLREAAGGELAVVDLDRLHFDGRIEVFCAELAATMSTELGSLRVGEALPGFRWLVPLSLVDWPLSRPVLEALVRLGLHTCHDIAPLGLDDLARPHALGASRRDMVVAAAAEVMIQAARGAAPGRARHAVSQDFLPYRKAARNART